jgi:hypothetical protein
MRRFPTIAFAAATAAVLVVAGILGYLEYSGRAVPLDETKVRPIPDRNRGVDAISAMTKGRPDGQFVASRTIKRNGKELSRQEVQQYLVERALNELLMKLPTLEAEARDAAIKEFVADWRQRGLSASQAIGPFLRDGKDFALRDGYALTGNRLQLAPTLRLALIDAALDFEGNVAVMLEVLRAPKSMGEVEFAVRNLEERYPGVYRKEALAALEKTLAGAKPDDFDAHQRYFFGAIQHFQAAELLPVAERMVVQGSPSLAAPYAQALAAFPVEVRRPALTRLFADPNAVEYLVAEPRGANDLDYSDPEVGAQVVQLFATRLNAQQRSNFLQGFNGSPRLASGANFYQPSTQQAALESPKIAQALPDLQGRKAVLAQLAPHADTPELQGELTAAQRDVTAEIAWRETAARSDRVAVDPLDVPIGDGVGRAVIKGKRIESLELAPQ